VCFSQLMLLIHMEYELENEEDALHNTIDICYLFSQLISALRRLELVRWLSRTEVTAPVVQHPNRFGASSSPAVSSKRAVEDVLVSTALEEAVAHSVGFSNDISWQDPLTHGITAIVKDLCAADSHIEIMPTLIQASLIKKDRADLALDLAPFCDDEPFSVYVQGRVALALGDFDTAAVNFRKAATGMSSKHATDRYVGGLLDDTEKGLLHSGLASYYRHIVAVFEKARAYSYVIDFASMALQFHTLQPPEQGVEPTKTEILSRLFNAAVKTARYELAHTSLQSMGDARLQASCLGQLVDRMCESGHSADMMALPFGRLQPAVDDLLEQRCQSVLGGSGAGPGGDGRTPYHQILYAWRVRYSNYRGAATVLLDRIHKLRDAGEADNLLGEDGFDTPVTKLYLLLINALSCVDPAEAWILSEVQAHRNHHHHHAQNHGGSMDTDADGADEEDVDGGKTTSTPGRKRKVVTLADVRKEYQEELDRISAIQNNQFGFDAGDAMDIMV
jgi:nuclear pore complex protein Nup160